jgi:hypothetical protein
MTDPVHTLHGTPALFCAAGGPLLRSENDAVDVIGQAYGTDVEVVVLPVERLDPDFFRLATGVAGGIVQKFTNYGLRLVIRGDVSAHMRRSPTFRAFAEEANRARHVWFVTDDAELEARLAAQAGRAANR